MEAHLCLSSSAHSCYLCIAFVIWTAGSQQFSSIAQLLCWTERSLDAAVLCSGAVNAASHAAMSQKQRQQATAPLQQTLNLLEVCMHSLPCRRSAHDVQLITKA